MAAVAIMVAVVLATRDGSADPVSQVPTPARAGPGQATGSYRNGVLPPAEAAALQARAVADTLSRLTLEEKVAQVFLWGVDADRADAAAVRRLRARALGGVAVFARNPARVGGLARALGPGGPSAPLVVAAEPAQLGATDAPPTLADARGLRRSGIDGVLAPGLDVGPPDNPAVGKRAVSASPRVVARFARAAVTAYGGAGVLAVPGPFPGLGSASQPVDEGPANVSLSASELEAKDAVPFRAAIAAGASAIQISNGLYVYDDFVTPGSLSREVMAGLLRTRLGFRGLVVSGDLTEAGVTALKSPASAAVDSLNAGADLLYLSGPAADQQAAYDAVLQAVQRKKVSQRRLDEAVTRVLVAKATSG
ncbi:MAG: glycoside hydrolase family 3 N-terminal domain-containing protein [Thermoleophilaceae bacterium]